MKELFILAVAISFARVSIGIVKAMGTTQTTNVDAYEICQRLAGKEMITDCKLISQFSFQPKVYVEHTKSISEIAWSVYQCADTFAMNYIGGIFNPFVSMLQILMYILSLNLALIGLSTGDPFVCVSYIIMAIVRSIFITKKRKVFLISQEAIQRVNELSEGDKEAILNSMEGYSIIG